MKFNPKKILLWPLKHKIIFAILIFALIGGGYFWYKSVYAGTAKASYVTVLLQKESIVVSVSGSGQVSALSQIDLKSKVSGGVVYVGAKNGQRVQAGTLLMEFDAADAQKAVRNAQIGLDNAKLSLQKLAGSSSVAVPLNKQQAQDNLAKAYADGFNTVSNSFLDLSGVMGNLDATFFKNINKNNQDINYYINNIKSYSTSKFNQANNYADSIAAIAYSNKINLYIDGVNLAYQQARSAYDKNVDDYKLISRDSDTASIEKIIDETHITVQHVSNSVKSISDLISIYQDALAAQGFAANSVATTQLSTLSTYSGNINTDLSNLLSTQDTIKNNKNAIENSDLELQSQHLSLQQAENALADAKDNLADYYIYASFAGTVANVALKNNDNASSGTVALTLITNQSMTEIPFNEVDIIKIKVGQKAVLTFDAIDGLSIAGQVADIDTLATVTQGVVNYNVKIVFDSQGTQIKPGMSTTAKIITDVRQNILTVPNSAIKVSGSEKYVQIMVGGQLQNQSVQTGLSNDTDTEITNGLKEGDNVVTQTITANTANALPQTGSAIRIPGINGGSATGFGGGAGGARNATGR